VFDYNKVIAPTYILSQIELEAKGYGIKNSIANFMNQFSYTLDPTNVLEYSNHGRVFFASVSKQNLKPSSWRIEHIKNCEKQIKNEKVMAPQSKGGQKLRIKTI
jgi:hypothetical protein